VKSLKSSSPRMNMISSEDSLVSLIPIIPSNNPNNMKTPSTSTASNSSLNTILNTIYSSEGMDTTTSTATGPSSSTTTSSSSSSFPSNSRSDYFSPDITMNTTSTISPLPRIVSPHNRTVSFDNHRQQQQHQQKQVYPAPVTPTEIVKGGDLLFFEGQPFRYLEHFEEVPHNNNTCNNDKKKNENNIMMKRQMMISKSKRSNYPSASSSSSAVQATRDTTNTVTDKFHDMISNIMLNIDSSSSLSPSSSSSSPRPFQNGLHQMQNTSCPV
jgi:hypothetical protein